MIRRSHRKSRNGCSECKRRHMRCDEGRPLCANCAMAERTCSYPTTAKLQHQNQNQHHRQHDQQQPRQQIQEPSPAPSSTHESRSPAAAAAVAIHTRDDSAVMAASHVASQTTANKNNNIVPPSTTALLLPSFHETFDAAAGFVPSVSSLSSSHLIASPNDSGDTGANAGNDTTTERHNTFSAQHLILFNHIISDMGDPNPVKGQLGPFVNIALRHAYDAPYLLDQALAVAAVHRARLVSEPESAASLRREATELQSRSVAVFRREMQSLTDERYHCVPRFLFATLLSLQVLAETLQSHHPDFHSFMDRFIECIDLQRGVHAVLNPNWQYLSQTELQPFFAVTHEANQQVRDPPGQECKPLERLLDESDLSASSISACRHTVGRLQWAFDMLAIIDDNEAPHAVSSFVVTMISDYVDVLRRQRPEALIILAYYGVLVHRSRGFWAFEGEAGGNIIRAIAQHLGHGYWSVPMRWPLRVLETE